MFEGVDDIVKSLDEKAESSIGFLTVKYSPRRAQFQAQFESFNKQISKLIDNYDHVSLVPLADIRNAWFFADDGIYLNLAGDNRLGGYVNDFYINNKES